MYFRYANGRFFFLPHTL